MASYDAPRARRDIEVGDASAVAFGREFPANPDLPARPAVGPPLSQPGARTFDRGVAPIMTCRASTRAPWGLP
jgi:2,4-dienoyl-CoA reductase-like NADH-dependent reductase (Old Yellow Enzyme family)